MISTKRIVILVAGVCVILAAVQPSKADEKYSGQFDDLDVEAILKNDEERDRYYACFMDTGPCHTEAAVFFKSEYTDFAFILIVIFCELHDSNNRFVRSTEKQIFVIFEYVFRQGTRGCGHLMQILHGQANRDVRKDRQLVRR